MEMIEVEGFTSEIQICREASFRLANRRLQPLGHLTVSKLLTILRYACLGRSRTPYCAPPVRCLPQVAVADDIIAIEDATRLVPAQFHATRSGMPARIMFRMAVRRKACGMLPV